MAPSSLLPRHPKTGLYALGFTSRGPIWPVLGGDESEDAAAQAAAAQAAAAAEAERVASERGFPAETPVAEMTAPQQAAYWKHKSRTHEDRVKALGGLTPDELTSLRDKAKKHDDLELELGSTADKAAAKAADEAKAATRNELLPEVISARLDAAAARAGVSEEDLAKAVEFADTAKLLGADGKVDNEKVAAFVATIAPAKGNQRRGPSPSGQGGRGGTSTGVSGRDLYADRHKSKSAS